MNDFWRIVLATYTVAEIERLQDLARFMNPANASTEEES